MGNEASLRSILPTKKSYNKHMKKISPKLNEYKNSINCDCETFASTINPYACEQIHLSIGMLPVIQEGWTDLVEPLGISKIGDIHAVKLVGPILTANGRP